MNTLSDGSWAEFEYEYGVVNHWVSLGIVWGWTICGTNFGLRSLWLGFCLCDWTSVPVIGFISLWLDFGPCDWALAPVIGLWSLWLDFGPCDWVFTPVQLTSNFRAWCLVWELVFGIGSWGFGAYPWVEVCLVLCWLLSCIVSCWLLVILGHILVWLFLMSIRLSLWFGWILVLMRSLGLYILSACCCWVSDFKYWTVRWCVYSIWCVNLFTNLCISIFPCGCEWWLLSSLLLMVPCVFSRYAIKSKHERDRDISVWGG